MKTATRLAAVFAAVLALSVTGCKNEPEAVEVESVTLSETTLTLEPDATAKLTATVKPDNADDKTVTWSSSDEKVATVSNDGTVMAHAEGTATITAKAGSKETICGVTVKLAIVPVDNVTLNETTITLTCGETRKLTATVTPEEADNKTVTWSSSNDEVATVSDDGTVTAVSKGTATVTAKAGGKEATCEITVSVAVERVTLNAETLTVEPGKTRKLTATVTPSNADDKTVAWSSSNDEVATVSDDGTITAVAEGTATITAQAGGKSAECTVTVRRILIAVEHVTLNTTTLTLTRGETGKLTATVTPDNADDKTVAWSSSNDEVATVDKDGTVTAIKAGNATITAQAGDITAECAVTVNPILVASVALDKNTLTLMRGETGTLTATVTPDNADDKTVAWSSSNADIATVDKDGTVTAVKAGNATITAQSGDIKATCAVTVNPILVENVTLNKNTLTLDLDETEKLTATVTPSNADDTTVTWSSSAPAVATVGDDGTITAVKRGTATVTARAGNKTAVCEVTVHTDHFYSNDICTACGFPKPSLPGGTITDYGVLTKYSGSEANVVIPEGVTGIYGSAFSNNKLLRSVSIPGSVTSIGGNAFWQCSNLTSVTIGNSVTEIGKSAFSYCTSLASVTIPASVTSIGESAFYLCEALTSMTIPDSVTSIGSKAFFWCEALTDMTIGKGVTNIGENAFLWCDNLESVNYTGTKEEWGNINIDSNSCLSGKTIVCTDGEISAE